MTDWRIPFLIFAVSALLFPGVPQAQDTPPPSDKHIKYSPYPEQDFPNQVFFGDTHLHTSYSTDAGMIGNTLGPEDAYRFARGETVTSSTGLPRDSLAHWTSSSFLIMPKISAWPPL